MARQIEFQLNLDDSDFNRGMVRGNLSMKEMISTSRRVSTAFDRQKRAAKSMFRTFRDGVIVMGLVRHAFLNLQTVTTGWVATIAKTSGEFERMVKLLEGLNNSTGGTTAIEKANKDLENLINLAKNAPFSINQLTNSFVKLRTTGMKDAEQNFKALTDSIASFGGTDEHLQRASIAIQQMAGKGVVSMEELRQQLGEAIPDAMQVMARGLGVTVGALVKQIETGTVEARGAMRAMFLEMERTYSGGGRNLMQTFIGATARLRTEVSLAMREIGEGGLLEALKTAGREVAAAISVENLGAGYRSFGAILGETVLKLKDFTIFLLDNRETIVLTVKALAALVAGFVAMRVIQSIIGIVAAFKIQLASVAGAATTGAAGLGRFMVATQALRASTIAGIAATAGLRVVLAALGGPIGLGILALTAFVTWIMTTKDAASEAAEAVRNLGERATEAQISVVRSELKSKQDELAALHKQIQTALAAYEAQTRNNPTGASDARIRNNLPFLEKTIAATAGKIEELQEVMDTVNAQKAKAEIRKSIEGLDDLIAGSSKTYRNALAQIKEVTEAGSAARRKAEQENKGDKDATDLANTTAVLAKIQAAAQAAGPALKGSFDRAIEAVQQRLDGLNKRIQETKLISGIPILEQNTSALLGEAERRLKRVKAKLVEVKEAGTGVKTELAKNKSLLQALEAIAQKGELTKEQQRTYEALRNNSQELDTVRARFEAAKNAANSVAKAAANITNMIRSASAEANRLRGILSGVFKGLSDGTASKLIQAQGELNKIIESGADTTGLITAAKSKEIGLLRQQLATNDQMNSVIEKRKGLEDSITNGLKGRAKIQRVLAREEADIEARFQASDKGEEAIRLRKEELSLARQTAAQDIKNDAVKSSSKGARSRLAAIKREKKNLDAIYKSRGQIFQLDKIAVTDLTNKNVSLEQIKGKWREIIALKTSDKNLFAGSTRRSTLATIAGLSKENAAYQDATASRKDLIRQETEARIRQVLASVDLAKLEGNERVKAMQVMQERINQINAEGYEKSKGTLDKFIDDSLKITDKLENAMTGWISDFSSAFADMVVEGKFNFADLAKSIIKDLIKIGIQAAITGVIKMALGGGGFSFAHTGSIAGMNEGSRSGDVYNGLPRFHTGGMPERAGLGRKEVPLIAEEGEGIFTKGQMKALGLMAKGGTKQSSMPPQVEVNVINQTTQEVNSEQQGGRFDGEKYIIDVVMKNAQKPGKFRQSLKGVANS